MRPLFFCNALIYSLMLLKNLHYKSYRSTNVTSHQANHFTFMKIFQEHNLIEYGLIRLAA